jgi:hypothetical protein
LLKFQQDGLWNPKDNDVLWFVLDVDLWKREHIQELITACENDNTWHIAISNPCFEIWLLYHILENLEEIEGNFKNELHLKSQNKGLKSYNPRLFCPLIETALQNAKNNDTTATHDFPILRQTKVYLLAEQLLEKLGKNWL